MKTPIEMMMDGVEWTALPSDESNGSSDLPYVTHEGVLKIGEVRMRCYQLSNGMRVIEENDMAAFFGFDSADEFRRETLRLAALLRDGEVRQ